MIADQDDQKDNKTPTTYAERVAEIKRQFGFLPLKQDSSDQYRQFWSNHLDHFKNITQPFRAEFDAWPREKVYNDWYACGDAELYYSMIRKFKPNRVIEIGSGFCTFLAVEAVTRNGKGKITCIDPNPRTDLPASVNFERHYLQEVRLELFDELAENDILFIDSSHEADEAIYHYNLLDRLAPGVIVHHHDFLYPYPAEWPEEILIIYYYLNHPRQWEGLVNNALVRNQLGPEGYSSLIPNFGHLPGRVPGAIWTRKLANPYKEMQTRLAETERRLHRVETILNNPLHLARYTAAKLLKRK